MPRGKMRRATCPHCGLESTASAMGRHAPICVKNPAAYARYCEVLASAPGSKTGITYGRYVELSTADKTLPAVITLRRLAGAVTWDAVLTVFGLALPEDQRKRRPARTEKQQRMTAAQREQAACADVAAQHAAMRSVLETERNRQYGIEVCRIVSEPGLRINGNECVRLVLR